MIEVIAFDGDDTLWHKQVGPDPDRAAFPVLESLADLPACIDALSTKT